MRKAMIVTTFLSGMALTSYFVFPNLWGSDPVFLGAPTRDVAAAPRPDSPGVAQVSRLHSATNDVAPSMASGAAVVAIRSDSLPWSNGARSQNWADTWRDSWFHADVPQRVDLIETIVAQADQLATDGDPFSEPQRDILNGLLLDAARAEQNPAVMLKLLPVLAMQERSVGEPILTAYLANTTLTAEVRATAAEILVESGWWSPEQLHQWLDDPARAADERAAILEELANTVQAWAVASYRRSPSN